MSADAVEGAPSAPQPSMWMLASMSLFSEKKAFAPPKAPMPSSCTVPRNTRSPSVSMPAASSARISESSAARARVSSTMPGQWTNSPSKVALSGVSSP